MEESKLQKGDILDGEILIIDKISTGFFGTIFLASFKGKHVIMKEDTNPDENVSKREISVYKDLGGTIGFPTMHRCGRTPDGNVTIVLDRLGDSLEQIKSRPTHFDINTICMIGISVTYHLEKLHRKGYIHGDLKPANILSGLRNTETEYELFLIDFGNSWRYRNKRGVKFPSRPVGPDVAGTLDFAPRAWHNRISPCRRDDFESLLYTMAYLHIGKLPWSNMPRTTPGDIHRIGLAKDSVRCNHLFDKPNENFKVFFQLVFKMNYFERPRYHAIRHFFRAVLRTNKVENEKDFPWLD